MYWVRPKFYVKLFLIILCTGAFVLSVLWFVIGPPDTAPPKAEVVFPASMSAEQEQAEQTQAYTPIVLALAEQDYKHYRNIHAQGLQYEQDLESTIRSQELLAKSKAEEDAEFYAQVADLVEQQKSLKLEQDKRVAQELGITLEQAQNARASSNGQVLTDGYTADGSAPISSSRWGDKVTVKGYTPADHDWMYGADSSNATPGLPMPGGKIPSGVKIPESARHPEEYGTHKEHTPPSTDLAGDAIINAPYFDGEKMVVPSQSPTPPTTSVATSDTSNPTDSQRIIEGAKYLGKFKVSFLCSCPKCRLQGVTPTASYTEAIALVDPSVVPIDEVLYLDGIGEFISVDGTGTVTGNRIDVYKNDHVTMSKQPVHDCQVYIKKTVG